MGEKRPDQHRIDPAESGSAEAANRERQEQRDRTTTSRGGEGNQRSSGGMTDDERVDEASEESFPASDPPAQP